MSRAHRLRSAEDFKQTIRAGSKHRGRKFLLHARTSNAEEPARFGFIISRAVGNAVQRNKLKRRLSAIAREAVDGGLTSVDVVIRAFPGLAGLDFQTLRQNVTEALPVNAVEYEKTPQRADRANSSE